MPVEKNAGAVVYAGTINQSGALEICVERIGRDTSFGKIIEAVERAEKSRAPIQGIADRLAGYLVYFALAAAVITFLVTQHALDDFRGDRRRSVWNRRWNATRDSGRNRPGCSRRSDYQG